jgi:DNA-binding NtrC family response regulator
VKGSFTGASYDKPGLFEHADGGTLFLDEIGDMPLATQAKLLRVLQNQEVQRVGSLSSRHVNVRVVAATNHDLRALIAQKCFREDLFYRLSMVEIHVPRLAQRKEDLPLLERHFLARFAGEYGKAIHGLTPAAETRLSQHSWPGNVRELENVIGHAAMMTSGDMIDVPDLPPYLKMAPGAGANLTEHSMSLPDTLENNERQVLVRALAASGGNRSKSARSLRIGRDALRYKLRKYNLDTREPLAAEGLLPETPGNTANSRISDTRLRTGAQPESNGSGCDTGTRLRNTA